MLVGGDGMEYRNALHSLKGVAGNIGCMDLCACISDLEKRYQDRLDPPSMKQLMDSLGRALQAMQAYLQGDDVRQEDAARCVPQQSAESVPEGELKTQLIALQSALSLGETDALYVVHSLQKILAGTPLLASINEIAADVADFEFDAAEEKLSIHFGSYLTHECL
jgi:HPt (histidine-containing phosphotransfer) domain-containing protein